MLTLITAICLLVATSLQAKNREGAPDDNNILKKYHADLVADKKFSCRTYVACDAQRSRALKAGHIRQALASVDAELALAETDLQLVMAMTHKGDLYAKTAEYPVARAWYRFALERMGNIGKNKRSAQVLNLTRRHLQEIAQKNVIDHIPLGGAVFETYPDRQVASSVFLLPVKNQADTYHVAAHFVTAKFDYHGEVQEYPIDVSGDVHFHDGIAEVRVEMSGKEGENLVLLNEGDGIRREDSAEVNNDAKCLMELDLGVPEMLTISVHGSLADCGFGAYVSPEGTYYLTAEGVKNS